MNRPSVSVALCTYQGAAFVRAQLDSILGQTRAPDEVVVFDDGSTDGTVDEVRRIAGSTEIPVHIHVSEVTHGYRRNFGRAIEACTMDVIFLADQDDVWLPRKVARMLEAFETEDALVVHCDGMLTDATLRSQGTTIFGRQPVLATEQHRPRPALQRRMGIPGATMAMRSGLKPAVLPLSDLWGHDLWIGLIAGAVGKIVPVPATLMLYRRHPGGAGPSRHLDAGRTGRARMGLRSRETIDYALDLSKWQQLVERVEALVPRYPQAAGWLEEYRRRLELAAFREAMRRRPRRMRAGPVLRRVLAGDYRRYLRSLASPVKDLVT